MSGLFPFIYGADGKVSYMAILGLALAFLAFTWLLAKVPFLRAVKP